MRRILLALLFALSVGAAHAQNWGNMAVISGTMGNNANRLCIGDGSRPTDIGCPSYAPSVTTAGDVSISGNVSANRFIGDGSGLTGVATNLSETIYINDLIDAYVSGTGLTQSIFLGAHAGDSLTTGTYNVALGYSALASVTTSFRNTAVGPQTLANITDSTKSVNNVAFGFYAGNLATVARNSVIVGAEASRNVSEISNSVIVGFQAASAAGTRTINAALLGYKAGVNLISSTNNTLIGMQAGTNLTTGSDNIIIGYNAQARTASTNFGLNVGNAIFGDLTNSKAGGGGALIGINAITPTVSLEVSGTVSATRFIGDGSGLAGVVAGSSDRIVSGTASATSMVAISSTGIISVTQNGTNTAYFHPQLGLVAVGVSTTGPVSATGGYFSGNVGIGVARPSRKLEVAGIATNLYAPVSTTSTPIQTGDTAIQVANLAQTDYAAAYLSFKITDSATTARQSYIAAVADGGGGHGPGATLAFGGRSSTGYSEWMRINTLGKVGIGLTTPNANLDVSGTVSATRFIGDGSGLTGIAQGDRITSGTAFVKALQDQGGEVSGTLKLTSTGSENCGVSTYNTIRLNPSTNKLEICRP